TQTLLTIQFGAGGVTRQLPNLRSRQVNFRWCRSIRKGLREIRDGLRIIAQRLLSQSLATPPVTEARTQACHFREVDTCFRIFTKSIVGQAAVEVEPM